MDPCVRCRRPEAPGPHSWEGRRIRLRLSDGYGQPPALEKSRPGKSLGGAPRRHLVTGIASHIEAEPPAVTLPRARSATGGRGCRSRRLEVPKALGTPRTSADWVLAIAAAEREQLFELISSDATPAGPGGFSFVTNSWLRAVQVLSRAFRRLEFRGCSMPRAG